VFVVCKLKVKIRRNCFPQTQIPCGKFEIFLMLNPMPAQLLRQTRTAPYSKKEITDVCQIHSQKKQKERKKERRPGELLLLLLLTNPSRLSVVMSRKRATVVAEEEAEKKKKTLTSKTGRREAIKQTTLYLHQKRFSFSTAHQQQLWHQAIMNILSRIVLTPKLEYKMPL
jgi:hypothetical protein